MSALIAAKSLYASFTEWIIAFGVIGTSSGTLIGNAVSDLAKAIASLIVAPMVQSTISRMPPRFDGVQLITACASFAFMIMIAFSFALMFGVQKARPVTLVKVLP
jgi:hypothetical protein